MAGYNYRRGMSNNAVQAYRRSPPQQQGQILWLAVFLAGGVALLVGDRFDISSLTINSAVVLALLPLWLLTWWMMGRNWLIMTEWHWREQ